MNIKTKYNIGDMVFWLNVRDGIVMIEYNPIKSINIGKKEYEKYEISYTARAERDVYTNFKDAKKAALKKQRELNKRAIEIIENNVFPIKSF